MDMFSVPNVVTATPVTAPGLFAVPELFIYRNLYYLHLSYIKNKRNKNVALEFDVGALVPGKKKLVLPPKIRFILSEVRSIIK